MALGSTLNVLNYSQALGDCIEYNSADTKFDTTGATKTRIKISLASSYDELMADVSKSLTLNNKGSIGVPGVSGEVDLNLSVKKTDYDKSVDRSVLIGLTARSEWGREYITHYALKTPYKDQVASKSWTTLTNSCGTHFVRADTRVSQLTLVISITGLDRASKSTLTSTFNNSSKGTFKIGDVGGSASSSITANLTTVVELNHGDCGGCDRGMAYLSQWQCALCTDGLLGTDCDSGCEPDPRISCGGGDCVRTDDRGTDRGPRVVSAAAFFDLTNVASPALKFYSFAAHRTTVVYEFSRGTRIDNDSTALSVSPDGRSVLYTQIDQPERSNLILVENFR